MCIECTAADNFKRILLEELSDSLLYLGFDWRDFPENSYISFSTHALQMMQVWV